MQVHTYPYPCPMYMYLPCAPRTASGLSHQTNFKTMRVGSSHPFVRSCTSVCLQQHSCLSDLEISPVAAVSDNEQGCGLCITFVVRFCSRIMLRLPAAVNLHAAVPKHSSAAQTQAVHDPQQKNTQCATALGDHNSSQATSHSCCCCFKQRLQVDWPHRMPTENGGNEAGGGPSKRVGRRQAAGRVQSGAGLQAASDQQPSSLRCARRTQSYQPQPQHAKCSHAQVCKNSTDGCQIADRPGCAPTSIAKLPKRTAPTPSPPLALLPLPFALLSSTPLPSSTSPLPRVRGPFPNMLLVLGQLLRADSSALAPAQNGQAAAAYIKQMEHKYAHKQPTS